MPLSVLCPSFEGQVHSKGQITRKCQFSGGNEAGGHNEDTLLTGGLIEDCLYQLFVTFNSFEVQGHSKGQITKITHLLWKWGRMPKQEFILSRDRIKDCLYLFFITLI